MKGNLGAVIAAIMGIILSVHLSANGAFGQTSTNMVSGGTANIGNPVMVRDIREGDLGSAPAHLTPANGMLFFVADDGVHGWELWKSDGRPRARSWSETLRLAALLLWAGMLPTDCDM